MEAIQDTSASSEHLSIDEFKRRVSARRWQRTQRVVISRTILCVFDILLLWCTALSVVLSIVRTCIRAPPLPFVYNECLSSYNVVTQEHSSYSACVRAQGRQCDTALRVAVTEELSRSTSAERENALLLSSLQNVSGLCASDYSAKLTILQDWVIANPLSPIIINSQCSEANASAIQTAVGDHFKSSGDILFSAETYNSESDQRVARLSFFSEETDIYSRGYLDRKVRAISQSLSNYLNRSDALREESANATLMRLQAILWDAEECLNVNFSDPMACRHGTSYAAVYSKLREQMDVQVVVVQTQIAAYESKLKALSNSVSKALGNVQSFYNAVNGAQGVMSWLVRMHCTWLVHAASLAFLFRQDCRALVITNPFPSLPFPSLIVYEHPRRQSRQSALQRDAAVVVQLWTVLLGCRYSESAVSHTPQKPPWLSRSSRSST